jgi:hypothetical protein
MSIESLRLQQKQQQHIIPLTNIFKYIITYAREYTNNGIDHLPPAISREFSPKINIYKKQITNKQYLTILFMYKIYCLVQQQQKKVAILQETKVEFFFKKKVCV